MNMEQEQYQPRSVAAAVVGDGDNDDNDDDDNTEEQPHDNTGSDTDNGDDDNDDDGNDDDDDDDDDEENASDIDVDNDADADAAVHRLLRALFDWMQKRTSHVKRIAASAGKLGSILLHRKDFPYRQRKKIRALVTDFFRNLEQGEQMLAVFQEQHPDNGFDTMDKPIKLFLKDLCRDIGDMLCDQSYDEDKYRGLDSSRDTEEEVITAIRFFPETLTNVGGHWGKYVCVQVLWKEDGSARRYSNTKAVFFVHVLAKLAIEYNSFEEDLRGGLLDDDAGESCTSLAYLVYSQRGGDEDYHRNADNVFLEELIRLYQMDLFKKEDIQRFDLLRQTIRSSSKYFEERRFRFLVQLDPYSLLHNTRDGYLPLYFAATNHYEPMQRFRSVFDAVMRYFPYQNGIASLFRKNCGETPFQNACGHRNKRRQEVMETVENIVSRYSKTTPVNTEHALILAATDNTIHLDCVFFLLKRQPDVLLSFLRQPPQNTTDSTTNNYRSSRSIPRKSKRTRN